MTTPDPSQIIGKVVSQSNPPSKKAPRASLSILSRLFTHLIQPVESFLSEGRSRIQDPPAGEAGPRSKISQKITIQKSKQYEFWRLGLGVSFGSWICPSGRRACLAGRRVLSFILRGGEGVESGRPLFLKRRQLLWQLSAFQSLIASLNWVKDNPKNNKNNAQTANNDSNGYFKLFEKRTRQPNDKNSFSDIGNRFGNELQLSSFCNLHQSTSLSVLTAEGGGKKQGMSPSNLKKLYQFSDGAATKLGPASPAGGPWNLFGSWACPPKGGRGRLFSGRFFASVLASNNPACEEGKYPGCSKNKHQNVLGIHDYFPPLFNFVAIKNKTVNITNPKTHTTGRKVFGVTSCPRTMIANTSLPISYSALERPCLWSLSNVIGVECRKIMLHAGSAVCKFFANKFWCLGWAA